VPLAPAKEERIACPDCGREQQLPPLAPHTVARCERCGAVLDAREPPDSTALALAVAGAVCAVLANFFPIIEVRVAGREQADLLFTGPRALSADGFGVLGALVACFSIIIPMVWLGLVAWVLFTLLHPDRPPFLGPTFRLAEALRPWAMTEVFVIGAFVAYTRLQALGRVSVGIGGAAVAATERAARGAGRSSGAGRPPASRAQRPSPLPERRSTFRPTSSPSCRWDDSVARSRAPLSTASGS